MMYWQLVVAGLFCLFGAVLLIGAIIRYNEMVPGKTLLIAPLGFLVAGLLFVISGISMTEPSSYVVQLPPKTSLVQLDADALHLARLTHWPGLGVTNAASASCFPPTVWKSGETFACFVYEKNGTALGAIQATVLNAKGQWKGAWVSGV